MSFDWDTFGHHISDKQGKWLSHRKILQNNKIITNSKINTKNLNDTRGIYLFSTVQHGTQLPLEICKYCVPMF